VSVVFILGGFKDVNLIFTGNKPRKVGRGGLYLLLPWQQSVYVLDVPVEGEAKSVQRILEDIR